MPLHPPGPPTINVSGSDAAIVPVSIQPQTVPASYVTVRLTNGDSYYTAGGTSVSGGSVLTADQGSPNTIGNAWPVKITDGTNIYGSRTVPIHSLIASGGIGVGVSSVSSIGALRVDVVQTTGMPSGSLTGLLVGGLNVANSNPVPVSDAGGSITVDGTVTAAQGTAAAIGSPWPVIIVSGSDAVGTQTHPTWITGSVSITNQAGAGSNVTVLSGSLTGLLVGGVTLSNANPVPISDAGGSLTVDGTVVVTSTVINSGSVAGVLIGGQPASNANPIPISDAGGSITVDGTVTTAQGTPASIALPWPVIIVSGSDPVGTQTHPTWITGSVSLTNQAGVSANVTTQSGSVAGLLIGGLSVANSNPIPISDAGGSITVDGTVTVTSTAINSGSITGLLIGGVALSNANPAPISDAGGSITVDGTVTVTQGTAAGIGAPWPVVLVSGSNVVGSTTNPIWVTGSVYTLNPGAAGSNVTSLSGSITGLLVGGLNVANSNPIPISDAGGSITVDGSVTVTSTVINSGSVAGVLIGGQPATNANPVPISDAGGSLTVDGTVTTTQGTPASIGSPWPVILVSGSNVVGSTTNPIWVTGSVYTLNPGGAGSNVTALSGSITGLLVGGLNVANSNPVPISDAGGSITVDGSVTTTQGTAASINAPWPVIIVSGSDPVGTQTHPTWITGSVSLTNQAGVSANVTTQSGSVIGLLVGGLNVANANPVPISDAGGSITVDGTVTATVVSTVINSGSLTGLLLGGVAASNANPIPISDAGGSLTVDGTVTAAQGTAASIGAPWPVIIVSGSDPVGTQTHPTWITGSVAITNQAGVSANVTVQSGSTTGLLVGGLNVANSNPVPISDAGGSLTIDGTVAATQGTPAAISSPWPVILVSGSDVIGSTTNPIWVTGSVYTLNTGAAGSNVTALSGSVTGLLLGGLSVANNNPIPISDSGGSITVDGTVTVTSTIINSGSVSGILIGGQPATNANPVPISDAGGSITVDGTVTVTSTAINSGSLTGLLVGGVALSNANPVPISDAGGSITVDGTVTATVASTVINSGSLTGLLLGGVAVSNANPIPISDAGGSLTVDGTVTVASTVINSGSVAGVLIGGQPASNANPVPISDAGGSITVDGTVTATVASTIITSGSVTGLLVGGVATSNANPIPISDAGGSITVDGTVVVSSATISSGSITGLLVGGLNVANSNPVPISDAGGSITIDGTVTATVASTVISTGSITGLLVGGLNVANSNPIPISDAGGSLTVDGTVTIASGSVTGLLVGGVAVSGTNPVPAIAYDGMGAQWQSGSMREISYAFLNSATSGSTQIVAAQGAGIKITVLSVHVMTTSAVSVQFTSSGSSGNTNKTGFYPIAANGGFVLPHNPHGWFRTNANEHLCLGLSAAVFTAATITWMPSI